MAHDVHDILGCDADRCGGSPLLQKGMGYDLPEPCREGEDAESDMRSDPSHRVLDGSDECIGLFMKAIDILGIDPDRLV